MRSLMFVAGLMLSGPALAQTKVVMAECASNGCRCSLSELDGQDVSVTLGEELPGGWQDMVLVNDKGDFFWSARSREDIDTAFGGDGQCDLELFGALVPQDGQWLGKAGKGGASKCPAGLEAQMQPQLDAFAFPRAVVWGGRFDPDTLRIGSTTKAINWTQVRPDHFTGTAVTNNGVGSSAVVDITVDYTATLVSPTRMDGTLALRVKAKGNNAGILDQLGMGDCKVDVPFSFSRTGG